MAQLIGTVGSITTASLMMVLTSAAGAPSHPPGKLTLTAPFFGTTAPSQYLYYQACAKFNAPTPFFKLVSGVAGYQLSASSRSCPASVSSYAYAQTSVLASIGVPFHKGSVAFFVNVSYSVNGSTVFHGGICSATSTTVKGGCSRLASAGLVAYAYLLDRTTGTSIYGFPSFPPIGNTVYNTTNCASGACSSSGGGSSGPVSGAGNFSWAIALKSGMAKNHTYQIGLVFLSYVSAGCNTFGWAVLTGCSDSGHLNFSTAGNGAKLKSIVET